jgi:hypothetical protein
VAIATLVAGSWAATVPPDRRPPTRPTVDGSKRTMSLRPVFTFGATDLRTPRGKLRFRCALDGASLRLCARVHSPTTALSFGSHTMRVRALDLAGNLSRVTSFPFVVVGRWDAASDFERAPRPANPGRDRYGNTAWFYLYSNGGRAHDPANYEVLPTFLVRGPNWEVWHLPPDFAGASAGYNNGRMIFHPSSPNLGQNAILGWRSPRAASVRVHASLVRGHLDCPVPANGVVWSLDQGNRTLRAGTLLDGSEETFDLTLAVTTGETLYVVVGDNGDSNCDATLVDFTIETN